MKLWNITFIKHRKNAAKMLISNFWRAECDMLRVFSRCHISLAFHCTSVETSAVESLKYSQFWNKPLCTSCSLLFKAHMIAILPCPLSTLQSLCVQPQGCRCVCVSGVGGVARLVANTKLWLAQLFVESAAGGADRPLLCSCMCVIIVLCEISGSYVSFLTIKHPEWDHGRIMKYTHRSWYMNLTYPHLY